MSKKELAAVRRGYEDYEKHIHDCPYRDAERDAAWHNGWRMARSDQQHGDYDGWHMYRVKTTPHVAICQYCEKDTPCLEADCPHPAGHAYTCPSCFAKVEVGEEANNPGHGPKYEIWFDKDGKGESLGAYTSRTDALNDLPRVKKNFAAQAVRKKVDITGGKFSVEPYRRLDSKWSGKKPERRIRVFPAPPVYSVIYEGEDVVDPSVILRTKADAIQYAQDFSSLHGLQDVETEIRFGGEPLGVVDASSGEFAPFVGERAVLHILKNAFPKGQYVDATSQIDDDTYRISSRVYIQVGSAHYIAVSKRPGDHHFGPIRDDIYKAIEDAKRFLQGRKPIQGNS